jgi:hypothetical protein
MKNYTSTVPASRTVSRIEELLVRAGAGNIMKDYAEGRLGAICFSIDVQGKKFAVRIPANIAAVEKIFLAKRKQRTTKEALERIRQQAERTAWKIMQDWTEVQISLIEMQQAEFLQVFLPYIWNGKTTMYLEFKKSGYLLPEYKEPK